MLKPGVKRGKGRGEAENNRMKATAILMPKHKKNAAEKIRRVSHCHHAIKRLARSNHRAADASATSSAVMLTIRRTVADDVSTCTGWAAPSRIGPIAMPLPAAVFSRL